MNGGVGSNNTTGVIGVYFDKRSGKYVAQINYNKQPRRLGSFKDKYDAVVARLQAEKELFGEYAPQKHLYEEYGIV